MRWSVLLIIALAGCSAAHAPTEEPDEAALAPMDTRPGSAAGADPPGVDPTPTSDELVPELLLTDCVGAETRFTFDPDVARASVPDPFLPQWHVRANGVVLPQGQLLHRQCDAMIGDMALGKVALSVGLVPVDVPDGTGGWEDGDYILSLATDHAAMIDYLGLRGLPVQLDTLSDGSVWAAGWTGILDTELGSGRIIGPVVESVIGVSAENDGVWFHRDDDQIARWTHHREAAAFDTLEAGLVLDPSVWGADAMVAEQWSYHMLDEVISDHQFVRLAPDGPLSP